MVSLPIRLGYKYFRSKKGALISLTSGIAISAMAIAISALIIVTSVMNGLEKELQDRILGVVPHVLIHSNEPIKDYENIISKLEADPLVQSASPYIQNQALISYGNKSRGVLLTGIDPLKEINMSILPDYVIKGSLYSINDGNNIIIGNWLASFLGVDVGDTITITTTNIRTSLIGSFPRSLNLTISGIFELKAELDQSLVIISHELAQIIDNKRGSTQSIRVKVDNLFKAQSIANELSLRLSSENQYYVGSSWKRTHGTLFRAIQMEKLITSLLLFLIVIVASFIILSTVMMTVKSKEREVGILKTIGATNKQLIYIFIFQGSLISFIGIVFGVILGLIGTLNVANLVEFIEYILQRNLLDQYFINYFPYSIDVVQIIWICVISFILSIIATLVPAFKVSKLDPGEILRYE